MFALILIPLAIVGAVLFSQRHPSPTAPSTAVSGAGSGVPSPIAVLCVFLQHNQRPPDMVIQCAIAEAQLLGRNDLVLDLTRAFGGNQIAAPASSPNRQIAKQLSPPIATDATPAAPVPVPTEDPYRSRPMTQTEKDEADMRAAIAAQGAQMPPGSRRLEPAQQPQMPPVMGYAIPDDFDLAMPIASAPVSPLVPSPIAGVPDDAWARFRTQLVNESPSYVSQRRVGKYGHRRDRLAEIGVDPDAIIGSADAQDAALGADLADAYRHMTSSGLIRHVGRPISIPDVDGAIPATLSGLLGVASVAGLDGCVGWLESKADHKRFPYTTQTFLRTNGAF